MPPEALKVPPVYSKKLDVFSSGVVAVQTLTQALPRWKWKMHDTHRELC